MKKFLLSVVAGISLTTTSMAQTVPSYVPTNGLVGYWGFDGNAQDYSGNGNHGTVNGATLTNDRQNTSNSAFSFNGNSNYISGTFTNFPLGNSPRSISAWVQFPNANLNNLNFITSWGLGTSSQSSANQAFGLYTGHNLNNFGIWPSFTSSSQPLTSDYNFQTNKFYHIVVSVENSGDFKLFVNGNPVLTSKYEGMNTIANSNQFRIGRSTHTNTDGWAGYFLGTLDDIAIYNRALTQQEVTALYNNCNLNPTINPAAANLNVGNDALFQVTSGGSNPSFQWQTNSNNLGWQNVPNNLSYSGANTASLTVNNVQLGNHNQPFRVIATSGSCSDTSDVASIHVGDTCLITVHDTLVINRTITGLSAPNNKNTIKVYPNPAKDHVIIHYGNFAMMNGYSVKITNTLGQELFASPINQQTSSVNLANWNSHSLYFVQIIDPQGKTVETRKILIE